MSLNAIEIGQLLEELAPSWRGAQIQKIHMRGPTALMLTLRVPGRSGVLRVSLEPGQSYLCLVDERGPAEPQASAFCMLLRKRLRGARVEAFERVGEDRVVALRGARGALMVEMFDRRGRFVLCDEGGKVVGFAPVGGGREGLVRGQLYEPPPPPAVAGLTSRFEAGRANEAIAAAYLDDSSATPQSGDVDEVARRLKRRLKRAKRRETKIREDIEGGERRQGAEREGELLKMSLGRVERGMSSIDVDDFLYRDGETVTIELDPKLSPVENLERIFKRARKARRTVEVAGERLREAALEVEQLEEALTELGGASAERLAELAELAGGLTKASGQARKRQSGGRRQPYRVYRDERGRSLYVGKSAADNDRLTVQVAKPSDLWLHARGYPGSHVVVPLNRDEEVDPERLVDAATLAAHFSEARGNATVEVAYTRRKYVQKAKGMPPGKVLVQREKVLPLVLEPDRLHRLLATRLDS